MKRPDFNPAEKFIAKKSFTCQGKKFNRGMPFPWRRMSISERQLRLLFEANFLTHPESMPLEVSSEMKSESLGSE